VSSLLEPELALSAAVDACSVTPAKPPASTSDNVARKTKRPSCLALIVLLLAAPTTKASFETKELKVSTFGNRGKNRLETKVCSAAAH
jgi:hypothetical protein